ncbi:NmrA-like family protein [Penicillium bovifimosum]|uniref:NmrA-like family protein n=1 Tax=Penicillium bovifimosum TaxID=126998 RepID=A0A9W9KZ08_9EURO|nr:NmrA-like family protein [Penicillium bovifimosum]KAJ5129633.1 NmrA-like family protein [Penicillium bovifimosum]
MSPTILVAGATGNTGRSATETLSKLIQAPDSPLHNHRILALTRSADSPAAQHLAVLPGVEVIEQNWVEITSEWLQTHHVVRAFIASQSKVSHFAEESTFHLALLNAGVKYVVRISTGAAFARANATAYNARGHWAIEALLSAPEFKALHWTSLQPNAFCTFWFSPAVEFIKEYRTTGRADSVLRLMVPKDCAVGVIDPAEVGVVAAHLLVQEDTTKHTGRRYVLNGPEDISGENIVQMIERTIGVTVQNVRYGDLSALDAFLEKGHMGSGNSRNVIWSIRRAAETAWEFKAPPTSKEVLELAAPKRTPQQMLGSLLE